MLLFAIHYMHTCTKTNKICSFLLLLLYTLREDAELVALDSIYGQQPMKNVIKLLFCSQLWIRNFIVFFGSCAFFPMVLYFFTITVCVEVYSNILICVITSKIQSIIYNCSPSENTNRMCRFFNTSLGCFAGNACRFLHLRKSELDTTIDTLLVCTCII